VNFELVKKLLLIEQEHSGYNIKRGILKELDKTLKQEYLHL
jgi:DNA sulfur modification protein DndC